MAQSVINYPKTREILYPLFLVNFLFFMWGFIWNLNNLLIALGALIAGFGLLIFIPSALSLSFPLFLLGTFVVFSGVTFLQIACNPYVRALVRCTGEGCQPDQSFSRAGSHWGFHGRLYCRRVYFETFCG